MLMILFGKSGVGKTYLGKLLKRSSDNLFFLEGDELLTEEMKDSISNKVKFTQQMRDEFTQLLIEKIETLSKLHKNIVVAQGLYKQKNREQILKIFPEAIFIQVNCEKRNPLIDKDYAEKIASEFEPMEGAIQFYNKWM